ncbi:NADAR family protein [Micromonospora zamorensis]|uniref:NADAR family protein n=1 Tax=Micromonospora zamorensis TaxID=709883 RepID=UPI00370F80FE
MRLRRHGRRRSARPRSARSWRRPPVDEQVWEQHRFDIVVAGAVAKFGQHEELREFLLGTGERVLVEASPVDRVWGIGMAVQHPHAVDPIQWRGMNLLGFALMQARTTLRAQAGTRRRRGTERARSGCCA